MGTEPRSPTLKADSLPAEPQWKPSNQTSENLNPALLGSGEYAISCLEVN